MRLADTPLLRAPGGLSSGRVRGGEPCLPCALTELTHADDTEAGVDEGPGMRE